MTKTIAKFTGLGTILMPMVALAQFGQSAEGILSIVQRILNIIIPILITLGVVYFIWGVIKYVTAKDEEAQKEARRTMVSGIIGLFVIVSIWGLVGVIMNTFGVGSVGAPALPCVPNPAAGIFCP